ncbi:hypothetical protein FGG08_000616 [Glutinoglossum americanum]|uniref:Uncharacterized protein n=1 Tax=Glutinoglossum americanum TaxID=1670608 RepID=A0A9P8IG75_9PEZI|nr:hypothetical protein FGG08_000616 [Glutinoglossum americanum]
MAARATSMPPTNARAAAATATATTTAAAIAAASIATNAGTGTAATSTTGTPSAASNAATAATSSVAAARALDLPTLQTESPHTLAARVDSVLPKALTICQTLTRLSRIHGVNLRKGQKKIAWSRIGNMEAILDYTWG